MKYFDSSLTDMPDELFEFGKFAQKVSKRNTHKDAVSVKNIGSIKRTDITLGESNEYNKPAGKYITYDCLEIDGRGTKTALVDYLSKDIKKLISGAGSLLCLGIGNPDVTSDALGPRCINNIAVTAGGTKTRINVSKFSPSVVGNTGINSNDVITALVAKVKPDAVIVIDSLCTRNFGRIGSSFQISDGGLVPGSGVGEGMFELTKKTLGVKVVAIGVPTVVHFRSILGEYVTDAEILNKYNGLFVSPKEIDFIVSFCADVIAGAINSI